MRIRNLFIIVVVVGALFAGGPLVPMTRAEDEAVSRSEDLLRRNRYAEARDLLEPVVKRDPDDGQAWYLLGIARHGLEDIDGAIAANRKAAAFASVRPQALYNLACAHGLRGELKPASEALAQAIDAGFIDYDLMRTDPDIAIVRDAGRIEFPPQQKYDVHHAFNGEEIPYKVLLPRGYDPKRTYPALVSFAGGSGTASADWELVHLWGSAPSEGGWIAVVLAAPAQGWMRHPAHHALEELLRKIQSEHSIEGGLFHLVGFAEGARPATTYSGMSGSFFQTLTTVGNRAFARWDDDELRRFKRKRVWLVVGGEDVRVAAMNQRAAGLMREGGTDVEVTVLDGEGPLPASMLDGGLFRYLAERLR